MRKAALIPWRGAFMLMELMIVVTIIFVLFVLYFGGGFGGRESAQKKFTQCSRNLQNIHTSLLTYATDNSDRFPSVSKAKSSEAPLSLLIPKYNSQTGPFICPPSGIKPLPEGEPFPKKRISYAYVSGLNVHSAATQLVLSDEQINTKPKSTGSRVFAIEDKPPGNNHGKYGGNILFVDGSVRTIPNKAPFDIEFTNGFLLNPRPKPNSD